MSHPIAGPDSTESVDRLLAGLTPKDRRLAHDALVSSLIEGWVPDAESVALLGAFAAGKISLEQYRERVLARTTVTRR